MRETIAIATTAAFILTLGCDRSISTTTSPSVEDGEVVSEKQYSDHGFDLSVVVTRSDDGVVVSRANADDPTNGDAAEIWTDGQTIKWTGTISGQPVNGSTSAADMLDDPTTATCFHPVVALICVGAAAALLAGCAFGFSCEGGEPPPSNPPGGGGGVPGGGEGEPEPEPDDTGSDTGD